MKLIKRYTYMLSFWENKPLKVNKHYKNIEPIHILDNNNLLKFIDNELGKMPIKLKYTKHFSEEMGYNEKIEVLNFINTNYNSSDDEYKIFYSYDIFDFFFTNAVLIKFYLEEDNNLQVGMVIGKKKNITIGNKIILCMEGNFLCVIEKFRNLHISSIIINILTKKSIEMYGINCSYYTIGKNIKSPSFCNKQIHYIPINIDNLYDIKFLSNKYQIEVYKNLYDKYNFNNLSKKENSKLLYINGDLTKLKDIYIEIIFEMIKSYSKKNYYIFDNISIEELSELFMNKTFHHFLFFDKNNNITDYICLFRLDYSKTKHNFIKNGFVFFDIRNNTCQDNISSSMKYVVKYCHENNIIDMIITNKIYDNMYTIKTNNILNYYMYNIELSYTEPHFNGLVTI